MLRKDLFMVPGPTTIPDRVLQAMHRQMINHRSVEYEKLFGGITNGLQRLFGTSGDVITYPSSGTGALEAALVNTLSPGDKVLALSAGVFGDYFAKIAGDFGLDVEKMDFPWGKGLSPDWLAERLSADRKHEIKAILVTHNETSTGVTHDIKALSKARGNHPALIYVDAVSSLAAIPLKMDEWNLDVVVTGSQKGLMLPPGLSFLAMNARAWEAYRHSKLPKFYWDALTAKNFLVKSQNPYTPAISLLYGLEEVLRCFEEEGMENIFARHRRMRDALRDGAKAINLRLLAEDKVASPTVTAVCMPEGIEGKKLQKVMNDEYGVSLASGLEKLANRVVRVGHLGNVFETDILTTLSTLEMALLKMGVDVELGASVRAAQHIILKTEGVITNQKQVLLG
ncbi:pyridoxal-phosphate-dependent aminotransferase family protein [Desulfosporosinus sp. SYSU MS00001]|uniref:pyridoxal-phosphate-dependent aminotransferase family protein n=1 Tax=Desulfosporosinus sp. SYSU MS00001 TaxID=3416284 RepID=UPI003CED113C